MAAVPPKVSAARVEELTQSDFARAIGVTTRTLFNLRREGMPHRSEGKHVYYPVPAALEWYYARKYRPAEDPADVQLQSLRDSERRKAAADAEIAEMKRDELRGLLIRDEDAAAEVRDFCNTVMASLRTAPTRHAASCLNLPTMPAAIGALQEIMEHVIDEARAVLTAPAPAGPDTGIAA
jgi:phage terminase Nu1 subunit (DNA packaging protein)